MTLDELIAFLEEIRKEHGGKLNICIYDYDREYGHWYEVDCEQSNIDVPDDDRKRVLIG